MPGVGSAVALAFDEYWERFVGRLARLDDDEYFWEPVAGCWSVRADGARWRIDGNGGDGGPAGAPDPPPFTTIAWRIGHIALSFVGFGDRLFADGRITIDDVDFPGSAAAAREFVEHSYRAYWRDHLDAVPVERWHMPIGADFGPYAERSTLDLALHVLDEVAHHGGEVGVLRDLYARGVSRPRTGG